MMFKQPKKFTSADLSGDYDEQSVDFSVDPEMYTKLGIKKAKAGEESTFDMQKIYQFQLEKDIKKITKKKGFYKERNARHVELRETDPEYRKVAVPLTTGKDGLFTDTLPLTVEDSWKLTTKPYGELAHKRYLHYLAHIPPGPTEEVINDKIQRAADKQLWKTIQ